MNDIIIRLFKMREIPLFLFIIAVGILGSFISPYFLLSANFNAVFLGLSLDAIIVIAMCMLLISGGFDLSVGANLAFSGMVCGICMANFGMPWPIACLIAIACGTMIGVANGIMVTKFFVNPLIATLGMLTIVRSLTLIVSGDRAMSSFPKAFQLIGQGKIFGIPNPIWIFVFFVIAASISSSFMFKVSSRTSTNTGVAPRKTKAFAEDTKVKDGMITSSPSLISARIAAISSDAVHELVSNALGHKN